jgi:hypothetical protein
VARYVSWQEGPRRKDNERVQECWEKGAIRDIASLVRWDWKPCGRTGLVEAKTTLQEA